MTAMGLPSMVPITTGRASALLPREGFPSLQFTGDAFPTALEIHLGSSKEAQCACAGLLTA